MPSISILKPGNVKVQQPYDIQVEYVDGTGLGLHVFVYRDTVSPPQPNPMGGMGAVVMPVAGPPTDLGNGASPLTLSGVSETGPPKVVTITAMLQPANATGKQSPSYAVDTATVTVRGAFGSDYPS